ncbi:MAG: hypothetical protein R3F60_29935 [bacterium]
MEGGLSSLVQPDDMGDISLILLAQLKGWDEGQTGNQVGTATLNLFTGDLTDGEFYIDPQSFEGGDPANSALISFPDTSVTNSVLASGEQDISLELPLLAGVPLALGLDNTRVKGSLSMRAEGFASQNGVLAGYFTKPAILELITGLQAYCAANPDTSICGTIGAVIPPGTDPEVAYGILTALVQPDANFENGVASACAPGSGDCNAVGVCLLVEMDATAIAGVSPAQ